MPGRHNHQEKEPRIEPQPRNRRRYDSCRFISFWHRWGPHIDLVGGLTIIGMLSTMVWYGIGFIRDTQASNAEIHPIKSSIALVTVRQDRMDENIQRLMMKLKVEPAKKTPTEIILERSTPVTFIDETMATDDNSKE